VWGPQAPYLKQGFSNASQILGQQNGTPAFQGDTFAALDPTMLGNITSNAANMSKQLLPATQQLSGAGQHFMNLASGSPLDSYMSDLNNKNGALDLGNTYANSSVADNLIAANNRDIYRGLNENDIPQTRLSAIGSGNMGSSREMMNEAILGRGAEDRSAANAAQIRSNLFNQGTSAYDSNMSSRAAELANLFNQGQGAYSNLASLASANNEQTQSAATIEAQNRQGGLDQAVNQFNMNDTRPWDILNRFWGIVGNGLGQSTQGGSKSSSFSFGIGGK
jgi:hypothetical protein